MPKSIRELRELRDLLRLHGTPCYAYMKPLFTPVLRKLRELLRLQETPFYAGITRVT
jgi:hypothetical protein